MITEKKHLQSQLATAKKALGNRYAPEILRSVRLTCTDGVAVVMATDMEVALRLPIEAAEAPSNFDLLVPFAELEQLVKASGHRQLWIDETDPADKEHYLMLANGSDSKAKVHAWIAPQHGLEDWPPMLAIAGDCEQELVLTTVDLTKAMSVIGSAISKDATRPVLNGVGVDAGPKGLVFAATDSYRLHTSQIDGVSAGGKPDLRVVPGRFLRLVDMVARKDGREVVTLSFGRSERAGLVVTASFDQSGAVVSARLIDGQFPKYKQLIPEAFDSMAGFDAEQLLIGCKQVLAVREPNSPAVLHLAKDGWHMRDTHNKASVALTKANGARWPEVGFAIGLNPEFLADAVKAMAAETVTVEFLTPIRPVLVTGLESSRHKALLMPVRLAESVVPAVRPNPARQALGKAVDKGVAANGAVTEQPTAAAKAARTGKDAPSNQFLIEANLAMAKHYRAGDYKGDERIEKERQRSYHNGLVAYYLGKRKTLPDAGELAPGKASVVKARVTRIARKHGITLPS